jgi:hypothetical protein
VEAADDERTLRRARKVIRFEVHETWPQRWMMNGNIDYVCAAETDFSVG